jgi:DNA-binding transcriptional LysR family regulator
MRGVHINDLDLTQVRLLAELLRARNISLASRAIGLSQSAASHALAKLRLRLGDPLFTRTAVGLEPTPYGERLGIAAREALDVLVAGLASSRPFDPRTATRDFTVYMSDVGQMVLLPPMLAFLSREGPRITIRSVPIPLDDPGAALSAGEVDLAVGFFTTLTAGFLQSFLFHERYVCIVRAEHPNFGAGMTLEAFQRTPYAVADATGMATHANLAKHLARHGLRPEVALRVPSFHVLPMIIAKSELIAIIPGRLADTFASLVPIMVLPTPVPLPTFDIRVHWHERYHHDPAIVWLRRAFIRVFSRPRAADRRNK